MTTVHAGLPAAETHRVGQRRPSTMSLGWIFAKTMVVLTIVFTLGVFVPMWWLLDDPATGIGVGLMGAVWGAPGFGVMIGGAIWATRHEAAES